MRQKYRNFELCIADDCSTMDGIEELLQAYQNIDQRIKVCFRKKNGNICAATNSALEIATGEFVVFVDHDDILPSEALYCLANEINNRNNEVDLIYTDEDKIDEFGNFCDAYHKPDWNYVLFLQQNFVAHLSCYRHSVIKEIGGCRIGFEGSQDYDLTLRFVEKIQRIRLKNCFNYWTYWVGIICTDVCFIYSANY